MMIAARFAVLFLALCALCIFTEGPRVGWAEAFVILGESLFAAVAILLAIVWTVWPLVRTEE